MTTELLHTLVESVLPLREAEDAAVRLSREFAAARADFATSSEEQQNNFSEVFRVGQFTVMAQIHDRVRQPDGIAIDPLRTTWSVVLVDGEEVVENLKGVGEENFLSPEQANEVAALMGTVPVTEARLREEAQGEGPETSHFWSPAFQWRVSFLGHYIRPESVFCRTQQDAEEVVRRTGVVLHEPIHREVHYEGGKPVPVTEARLHEEEADYAVVDSPAPADSPAPTKKSQLVVPNKAYAALWTGELLGQVVDGAYMNRSGDHKRWEQLPVSVDLGRKSPVLETSTGDDLRGNFPFDTDVVPVVGNRMLRLVKQVDPSITLEDVTAMCREFAAALRQPREA